MRAEDLRQRVEDLKMLERVLTHDILDSQREAFDDMLVEMRTESMRRCAYAGGDYKRNTLSEKQRKWVQSVLEQFEPTYKNEVSSGAVPRGREVPTIEMLKPENLPKSPPRRRA